MTLTSKRIAEAVDDATWQRVRASMKGEPTLEKLRILRNYHNANVHNHIKDRRFKEGSVLYTGCDVCIRVDNYLKSLARGGQLYPGVNLALAREENFTGLDIKK